MTYNKITEKRGGLQFIVTHFNTRSLNVKQLQNASDIIDNRKI